MQPVKQIGKTIVEGSVSVTGTTTTTPENPFNTALGGVTRVAQKLELYHGKQIGELDEITVTRYKGAGVTNVLNSDNVEVITVPPGQRFVRQTKNFFNYHEGNPQLIELTQSNFTTIAGQTIRYGYFSSSDTVAPYVSGVLDGLFLESKDGVTSFAVASKHKATVSRTTIDTIIENLGVVSLANFLAEAINFLWLGGIGAKLSVSESGILKDAVSLPYAGTSGATATNMFSSPNQPIRIEIINDSAETMTFNYHCCTVVSEGTTERSLGRSYPISTLPGGQTLATASTDYLIFALRQKPAFRDVDVWIEYCNFFSAQSQTCEFFCRVNPTISNINPANWTDIPGTTLQIYRGVTSGASANVVTNDGTTIIVENTSSNVSGEIPQLSDLNHFGFDLANNSDVFAFVGRGGVNNTVAYLSAYIRRL